MRVQFVERGNAPQKLVCEAEIIFDEGPLAGMKLVGFSLWRGQEDSVFVSFPARAFGADGDRRYFDLLRSVDGTILDSRRVKDWILEIYREAKAVA